MTIEEYVTKVLTELDNLTGQEPNDGQWITVDFEIGVNPDERYNAVSVVEDATNRIRFSIDIKRGGK